MGKFERIDIFCHITPKKFIQEYVKSMVVHFLRLIETNVKDEFTYFSDPEYRIRYMNKFGIDIEVLTLGPTGDLWNVVQNRDLPKLVRVANDSLAEIVNKYPDKFIGIGVLPAIYEGFIDEVKRSIRDLGFKGVMILSNLVGKPVDADEMDSFYQFMSSQNLPVFIHPTNPPYGNSYPWAREYRLIQMLGWPYDTSLAMARVVFSGILDRYPNLKFVIHHAGAMIPFFSKRIEGFYDEAVEYPEVYGGETFRKLNKHPIEYFKNNFYVDTVLNGNTSALRASYEFYGIDHMVFATDYPFGPEKGERWTRDILNSVIELKLDDYNQEKIFSKNARQLLRI
ncbi:amidohydrolase family protein [Sulfolobus tengchongensis]|uniref:Amidohydrolase family protein n=1 Tax=Sulfolobus tengchongensis TaxID=207809 RepID=A0AAX4L3F6_9CREN